MLGRGGMGVVYQARHVRLNRLVALKMIRPGAHAGPDEVARLLAEAETQARLQHPHVVQIYEVGETAGYPYLALEFMEGGSLDRKLAGKPLPARDAAELAETLARAVHAAHEQGLVHRDLKPANVLLTAAGVPKVGDFGLAKWLHDAAESAPGYATRSGAVVGTPNYMAPEQAGGKGKEVGPAADTYALGAILYALLTGRPPFLAETPLDTLEQVRSQEPVSVRRLQPKVPRDLETICMKCLEKEPHKRYATAAALADDLRRYLDGQTIRARPVGPAGRLWRWGRRRPLVAGLAAGLVLVFAAALTGGLVQHQQVRAHLAESERQRERARRRFEQVFHLASTYIHELHDQIADLPGSTPALEYLVRMARAALDNLAEEAGDDPQLLRELAAAYTKIGHVQGNPFRPNLGDTPGALASYRKGVALTRAWADAESANAEARGDLALRYAYLADLQEAAGQTAEAVVSNEAHVAVVKALTDAAPDDAQARLDVASAHDRMGRVLLRAGRRPEALAHFRAGSDVLTAFAAAPAFRAAAPRDQALTHWRIGSFQVLLERWDDALASHREYVAVLERAAAPDHGPARRDLAESRERLGALLARRDGAQPALVEYHAAHALRERLARDEPHAAPAQRDLAASHDRLAGLHADRRAFAEALTHHGAALKLREALAAADPHNVQARRDVAASHDRIGDLHARQGNAAAALASYQRGGAILTAVTTTDPWNTFVRRDLAISHANVGRMHARLGAAQEALASYRTNLELLESLAKADPHSVQARRDLGGSHGRLGQWYADRGQPDEALTSHLRCLAIREELARADPHNVQLRRDLAAAWYQTAGTHARVGEDDKRGRPERRRHWLDARRCYEQARDVCQSLHEQGNLPGPDKEMLDRSAAMLGYCDKALATLPESDPADG